MPGLHSDGVTVPTEQAVPGGQITHCEALVINASDVFACVPYGHGMATAEPSVQYLPCSHGIGVTVAPVGQTARGDPVASQRIGSAHVRVARVWRAYGARVARVWRACGARVACVWCGVWGVRVACV